MSLAWRLVEPSLPGAPPGWSVRRIGDLVDLINGHPFDSADFGPTGSMPLVRIRDLVLAEFETYTSGSVPARVILEDGDVVVGMDGDFNVVRWARGPAALNQRLCMLRPRAGVDIRFVYYWLPILLRVLNDLAYSTTVKHLSSGEILGERMLLPSLEEQRRIADFLDQQVALLDRAVMLRREQKTLLAERHEAEIEVRLRPDGLATPEVPARHIVERIGVGIVIQPAALYTDDREDSVPAVRGKDISRGVIAPSDQLIRITKQGHGLNRRSELRRGDILVVRSGKAGAAAQVPEHLIGGNCIDVVIVRPGVHLDPRYAEYSINCRRAQEAVAEHSTGAIQRHFGVEDMKALPIAIRPMSEQVQIGRALDDLTKRHQSANELLEVSLQLLLERKRALIAAAVTGMLDVTTARSVA